MPIMEVMTEAWGEDPGEDGEEVSGAITNEDRYDERFIEPEASEAEPSVLVLPSAEPHPLPEAPAASTSPPILPAAPACTASENDNMLQLLQREMDMLRNLSLHHDFSTCIKLH